MSIIEDRYLLEQNAKGIEGNIADGNIEDRNTKSKDGMKWYSGVFIVLNAVVGVALFNVPITINQDGGIITTLIYFLIIAVINIGGILILGENVRSSEENNYFEIVFESCGKLIGVLSLFCIVMYSLGTIIVLDSLTADFIHRFVNNHVNIKYLDKFYCKREFLVSAASIVIVLPFIFSEKIKSLSKMSLISCCLLMYIMILTSIEYFKIQPNHKTVKWISKTDTSSTFQYLPTLILSIFMQVEMMQVYPKLNIRNKKQLLKISISASLFMITYYLYIGSLVSVQFGSATLPNFLLNYDKSIWVSIAAVIYIIKMQTSIPIFLFITKDAFESIYFKIKDSRGEEEHEFSRAKRWFIAIILFISTLCIAIAFPRFEFWVHLDGIVSSILVFFFPGIVLFKSSLKRRHEYNLTEFFFRIFLSIIYMILGLFCFILTCMNV